MKKKIVVGGIVVAIAAVAACHNSAKGAEKECPCGRGSNSGCGCADTRNRNH